VASLDQESGERPTDLVRHLADVLLSRIADGTYPLHGVLPAQRELAEEFSVSRDTVQRVLRELAVEGYVEARRGSGTRVIRTQGPPERPDRRLPALGPRISAAFESPNVTIDAFSLTSESLDMQLRLQVERVRAAELRPESISVRLLLPRIDPDLKLFRAVQDSEDRRALDRFRQVAAGHTASLSNTLRDLRMQSLVPDLLFEHRESPVAPMQKLYLLNGTELLSAYYSVVRRPTSIEAAGAMEEIEIYDTHGLDTTFHHHSAAGRHPDPEQVAIVNRARQWFEHAWVTATPSTAG
jgi:DNA-binding Lrp family transcriptional regulator